LRKEVTLVVDERGRSVSTFASTVGDLLEGQRITLSDHDQVTPIPETGLSDGMTVRVLLAKEITLLLNGHGERTVYVTGETVKDVLDQINVRAEQSSYLEPSRGASVEDGDVIVYRKAVDVGLTVDGETREIITNAPNVGYLLDSLGIVLDGKDRVEPSLETRLGSGMDVRVVRVEVRNVSQDQPIPYDTEVRKTDELLIGDSRVVREGVPGILRKTYRGTFEDGELVSRKLLGTRVAREPVAQIVEQGTREPRVQSGLASWYNRIGMVAAHKTLPFGTEVHVTNLANGETVTVVINDRGPYIGGRVIDLSDDAYASLAPLGSGVISVRLVW
jgi:resuscitation-promoting factor RpfB